MRLPARNETPVMRETLLNLAPPCFADRGQVMATRGRNEVAVEASALAPNRDIKNLTSAFSEIASA